jgi:RNA polymerase sigma factor (sigma-70 family)
VKDERRLARRAARGDRDAFTAIFRRYQQDLYRYCVAILGNPEDAQDALQNTMVKALRSLPGERREIDLKPWLYRIAHNESIDLIRGRRRNVSLEEDRLPPGTTLVEEIETRQRLRQLLADVGELPERQRGALLMREAAGLEFEQIATALGTTAAVARQTLYEARLALREMDAGRNMECTAVTKALSDGDRRVRRRRDLRAHLKACPDCRLFAEQIDSRRQALAAISPLPAVAAAALMRGLGGGGAGAGVGVGAGGGVGGSSAGGIGGAVGAGAGKAIGTATILKGAATLAAATAIGLGGADLAGVLHPTATDGGSKAQAESIGEPDRAGGPPPEALVPTPVTRAVSDRGDLDSPAAEDDAGGGRGLRGADKPPALPPPAVESERGARLASLDGPSRSSTAAGEPTASPAAGNSAVEHLHGPGHPKQGTPSAGNRGEAAAFRKGSATPASSGHAEKKAGVPAPAASGHPTHPDHPTKPSRPASTEPSGTQASTPAEAEPPSPENVAGAHAGATEGDPPGQSGTAPGREKHEGP